MGLFAVPTVQTELMVASGIHSVKFLEFLSFNLARLSSASMALTSLPL